MKETYFKLNREKLARRAYWLTILQDEGILEEVQEEEAAHMKAVEISHMTQQEFAASLPEEEGMCRWCKRKPSTLWVKRAGTDIYYCDKCKEDLYGVESESFHKDTKEDMPYLVEVENRKLQEESKQAIDNMFGNPLGQVDNMIKGTKVEEEYTDLLQIRNKDIPSVVPCPDGQSDCLFIHLDKVESKTFLDGIKPSDWLVAGYENYPMLDRTSGYALREMVGRMFDLLVEELKKKGSL